MALITQEEVMPVGQARQAEFKVLKDRDGWYYWHLKAASDRIIAWSGQAYDSKYWCVQDLNWFRANANLIMVTTTPASLPQNRRADSTQRPHCPADRRT